MERLTEKNSRYANLKSCRNMSCSAVCDGLNERYAECYHCPIQAAIDKLAQYEDAEEHGMLLRLPIRIGTDVFIIPSIKLYRINEFHGHSNLNVVRHYCVDEITLNSTGWHAHCDGRGDFCGFARIIDKESYKVTWFLTREEAEQKMMEMEGNEDD